MGQDQSHNKLIEAPTHQIPHQKKKKEKKKRELSLTMASSLADDLLGDLQGCNTMISLATTRC
jgi:hypothetical protein